MRVQQCVMGVSYAISAIFGPLLASLIIDRTGSYRLAIVFALLTGMLAFTAVIPLQSDRVRRHQMEDR